MAITSNDGRCYDCLPGSPLSSSDDRRLIIEESYRGNYYFLMTTKAIDASLSEDAQSIQSALGEEFTTNKGVLKYRSKILNRVPPGALFALEIKFGIEAKSRFATTFAARKGTCIRSLL